jgi:hypothetical protein
MIIKVISLAIGGRDVAREIFSSEVVRLEAERLVLVWRRVAGS